MVREGDEFVVQDAKTGEDITRSVLAQIIFDQEAKEFNGEETPDGTNFQVFQSINVIDLQNNRGTLVPTRGISAPHNKLSRIKRLLDVNYLTEGR